MKNYNVLVCIIDNGSSLQLSATLSSLKKQTVDNFEIKQINCRDFRSKNRNKLPLWEKTAGSGYVLFLYSGSVLDKNAIEIINKAIEKESSLWLYCDERTFDADWNGEIDGIYAKPAFGKVGFANYLYTGEGIVFSREILEKMDLKYEGDNFRVSLLEMGISAAALSDGTHIEKNILIHHKRKEICKEEWEILSDSLNEYIEIKELPYWGILNNDASKAYLYPLMDCGKSVSLILLGDSFVNSRETTEGYEVIVEDGAEGYLEKCRRGASRASGQVLCFVDETCSIPSEMDMKLLISYLQIPEVGIISPCLKEEEGETVYAGAARIGHGICSMPYVMSEGKGIPDYYMGTREISVPCWRFWMTRAETFAKISELTQESMSADYALLDYGLQLEQKGLVSLYCGDVVVRCYTTEKDCKEQSGFLAMLSRWGDRFAHDGYFTESMIKKALEYKKENTVLYLPENYKTSLQSDKRILVLTHELTMTGAPVVLSYAVKILREEGWQVVMVSPEDGVMKKTFLEEQVPVLIEESIQEKDDWLSYAKEFDLILVNTVVPFQCIEQLRNFTVPVIWWIHDARGGYVTFLKDVLPESLGENIHTLCVSKYAQDVVREFRPQYETELLLYGLEDTEQKASMEFNDMKNPENRKLFVSVGTIERRKGQDVLVQAIRLLPAQLLEKCLFLFVGKCMEQDVFDTVTELEQEHPDSVRHVNFIRHEDIFGLYRQASAVICASRDDPLPTFMAETMMQSGVCICSEHTGTAALIRNGVNGFVYENDSPEQLAECIRIVAEEEVDLESIRKEGRKVFENVFELDIFRKNLLKYVERYS